jgi:hypothetical protein
MGATSPPLCSMTRTLPPMAPSDMAYAISSQKRERQNVPSS